MIGPRLLAKIKHNARNWNCDFTESVSGRLIILSHHTENWFQLALAGLKALTFVTMLLVACTSKRSDTCANLLNSGAVLTCKKDAPWNPRGCLMHSYTTSEANECMVRKRANGFSNYIAFLGDSRTRELYGKFHQILEPEKQYKTGHFDLINDVNNTRLEYLWSSQVGPMESRFQMFAKNVSSRPSLLVTGTALWYLMGTPNMTSVKEVITKQIPYFEAFKNDTKHLWMIQAPVVSHKKFVHLMQYFNINNANIHLFNQLFIETLQNSSSPKLWYTYSTIAQDYIHEAYDGQHWQKNTKACTAQTMILFNYYCNDIMNLNESMCCNGKPEYFMQPFTNIHIITLAAFCLCFHITVVTFVRMKYKKNNVVELKRTMITGWYNLSSMILRLGIILLYILLSNRMKLSAMADDSCPVESQTSHHVFWTAVCVLSITGLLLSKKCDQPTTFSCEQTAELKGWLQLVIVAYQLTGASNVFQRRIETRLVVSIYFFLCGYSHLSYYFNNGIYPLHKFCTVLVRYNVLVIILCLLLGESYQFYAFVPVISLCYVIVYFVAAGWNDFNNNKVTRYVILATIRAVIGMTAVKILSIGWFSWMQSIDLPLNMRHTMTHNWHQDIHMLFCGIAFAILVMVAKSYKICIQSPRTQMTSFAVMISIIMAYPKILKYGGSSEELCHLIQSILQVFVIVSYFTARNIPSWLQSRHSYLFVWFGKISLEMYILQYHLLHALYEGRGRWMLISDHSVLNLIISTVVFICVAHEVHQLTNQLVAYILPVNATRRTLGVQLLGISVATAAYLLYLY